MISKFLIPMVWLLIIGWSGRGNFKAKNKHHGSYWSPGEQTRSLQERLSSYGDSAPSAGNTWLGKQKWREYYCAMSWSMEYLKMTFWGPVIFKKSNKFRITFFKRQRFYAVSEDKAIFTENIIFELFCVGDGIMMVRWYKGNPLY